MTKQHAVTSALVFALVACTPAAPPKEKPFAVSAKDAGKLAPREVTEGIWSHSPFEVGACETCHTNADPTAPGPVRTGGRIMCDECHEQFESHVVGRTTQHEALADCTGCHNPHNATNQMFLHSTGNDLCLECHSELADKTHPKDGSAAGAACLSCHDPHASNSPALLKENS